MKHIRETYLLLVYLISTVVGCANAYADGSDEPIPSFYQEAGKSANRDYVNQHPNEHIDPFTGKLQWHFVDLFIPGNGGFDLKVQRSYSSQSEAFPSPSSAGIGWTMHFGRVLRRASSSMCDTGLFPQAARNPVLELPDGNRQVLYIAVDGTSFLSTNFWKATCIANGMAVFSPDGTRYDMDVPGLAEGSGGSPVNVIYPSKITDRNGNWMSLTYEALGTTMGVSTVTTNDGRSLSFTYVGGNVRTISDGTRTWTYSYQASVSRGPGAYLVDVKRPDNLSWTYAYDDSLGTPAGGSMTSATYPTGGTINYTYGFVTFNAVMWGPRSSVVLSKTADAGTWTYSYTPATAALPSNQAFWTQADTVPPKVDVTVINGPDGQKSYRHVGYASVSPGSVFMLGALVQVAIGGSQGEGHSWMPQLISYQDNSRPGEPATYDPNTYAPVSFGRDINRDGLHAITNYDLLDQFGNPGLIVEAGTATRRTVVSYFLNQSKWIIHLKKDETTTITSSFPEESVGSITRTFDPNGNLLTENKYGVTTTFTYTAAGDIATRTDARGKTTSYSNYKRGTPQLETHPEGVTITRTVDDAGNVVSQTDGEGAITTYGYDGLNRLTSITHPRGNGVTVVWAPNARTVTRGSYVEKLTFDGFGREVLNEHMGAGPTIYQSTAYDPLGRVTFKSYPSSVTGTEFTYDILGRVLTAEHPAAGAGNSVRGYQYLGSTSTTTNERGLASKYTYRVFGDHDKRELMRVDAPDASASISLKRNGVGQVTEVQQEGKVRTFGFDARYFLMSKVDPETGTTSYGRDEVGNMTSRQVGASPSASFVYDGLNRLTTATYSGLSPITKTYFKDDKVKSVDTGLALQNYVYDGNKNLTSESMTIGTQVFTTGYAYDGNDALDVLTYGSGKTVVYSPDALGRPTKAAPYVTSVTHHPTGEVASMMYANGVLTNIGLNARKWPSSLVLARQTKIFDTSYGYDESGNVATISDAVDTSYSRSMGYDAIDRLVSANGSWGVGTFSYDGRGNIKSQRLGSFNLGYVYDPSNERLLSTTGSRVSAFTYDVYGNVTGNGATTFSYNNASDMTCAKCGQADQSLYDYDGSNMRVRVQKNGVTTYFMYGLGGKLLWERTPNSNIKEYVYLGGKQVATRQQPISVP